MHGKRSLAPIATFTLSLLAAIALLVIWISYVLRSSSRISELAGRVGLGDSAGLRWWLLGFGILLFSLLITGITYQLAQALAARRLLVKQDEFVSNITHELRSPLAAIRLHAQTLQQPGLGDEARRRSTRFILQQAERMDTLVDNVLESSRLMTRRQRLELVPVELAPFLERYVDDERPRVESRGVRLDAVVDTAATVAAEEGALRRVLDNLLDNAARFSAPGGEVRLRVADEPGRVRLEVQDDGVGIPRSELKRVFDRFYQVGRGRDGTGAGTGLGLSIVYGLVSEMRGEVHAFSQEGRPGARFVVHLPRDGRGAAADTVEAER
jgi:signal transduction histidine kinase